MSTEKTTPTPEPTPTPTKETSDKPEAGSLFGAKRVTIPRKKDEEENSGRTFIFILMLIGSIFFIGGLWLISSQVSLKKKMDETVKKSDLTDATNNIALAFATHAFALETTLHNLQGIVKTNDETYLAVLKNFRTSIQEIDGRVADIRTNQEILIGSNVRLWEEMSTLTNGVSSFKQQVRDLITQSNSAAIKAMDDRDRAIHDLLAKTSPAAGTPLVVTSQSSLPEKQVAQGTQVPEAKRKTSFFSRKPAAPKKAAISEEMTYRDEYIILQPGQRAAYNVNVAAKEQLTPTFHSVEDRNAVTSSVTEPEKGKKILWLKNESQNVVEIRLRWGNPTPDTVPAYREPLKPFDDEGDKEKQSSAGK